MKSSIIRPAVPLTMPKKGAKLGASSLEDMLAACSRRSNRRERWKRLCQSEVGVDASKMVGMRQGVGRRRMHAKHMVQHLHCTTWAPQPRYSPPQRRELLGKRFKQSHAIFPLVILSRAVPRHRRPRLTQAFS